MKRYVYYVNIGNLSTTKAEEYLTQLIEDFNESKLIDKEKESVWFIPIREGDGITRIELLQ